MEKLQLVDACTERHFQDMSLLHALGWRAAYRNNVPGDYMAREITDERWTAVFRKNVDISAGDTVCSFSSPDLACWGELISLYGHPGHWGKGCGTIVMEEILHRLKSEGYPGCFLYVLQENARARRFYEKHNFLWDGHSLNVTLTPDTILTDLRYRKEF